ncbi:MAG: hypothetical protein AAF702_24490 [Chloroflexota bacterium]
MNHLSAVVSTEFEATGDTSHMVSSGKLSLSDIYGEWIIYRNLEPLPKKLRGMRRAAGKMGIDGNRIPRKHEVDYARASMWFLNEGQKLRRKTGPLKELLFIGDSLFTDGTAFTNLANLSEWRGSCFIGNEKLSEKPSSDIRHEEGFYLANRWSSLASWLSWGLEQGFSMDDSTAVIVDIDKTVLGAKGRNDHVIDQARLDGIYRTMDSVLGDDFDRAAFERQYAELNKSTYHVITADNQDYLAYICLVLNAKLLQLDELVGEVEENRIDNFDQLTRWVNTRLMMKPTGGERFRQVHEAVMMAMHQGDPTPFKRFRQQEFMTTIERMGSVPDSATVEDMLSDEITITREVVDASKWLAERGCILLCMSDKPDEAVFPKRHLEPEFLPVHQIATHCVGYDIHEQLRAL